MSNKKFFRPCPDCKTQIGYSAKGDFNKAIKHNTCCRKCKNKPKVKLCDNCGCNITYKTHAKKICDECRKKKTKSEAGTRNCPQCNRVINYSSKYERQSAEKKQTICSKCRGAYNGKLRKGKNLKDIWIEKGIEPHLAEVRFMETEKKRLKSREGYRHSQETITKIKQTSKNWKPSAKTKKAMMEGTAKRFAKPEEREKIKLARLKVIAERPELEEQRRKSGARTRARKEANGEYLGGCCKLYTIAGLRCQGNWERMYIEGLVKKKQALPFKAKTIKTSYGYYTPDFEYKNHFVEIKSTYTFDVCIGKKKGWNGKKETKQLRKIIWVSENVKPVHILVLDKKGNLLKKITDYSIFKSTNRDYKIS